MDTIPINEILNRELLVNSLVTSVREFFENKNPALQKGIYVYGAPGSGKTEFVMRTIKSAGYDVIKYDAGDIRNKSVIECLTKHHMPDVNIMSLWNHQKKKIVIVMDEIDGMNNGDKGGITALIKLIRPKKTKKQLSESHNYNPIICIGSYHIDKKISELMKVCDTFEITTPTHEQIETIIKHVIKTPAHLKNRLLKKMVSNINGDLRKLAMICDSIKRGLYVDEYLFDNVIISKSKNEDAKQIVHRLLNNPYSMQMHETLISETDRTIVGLLWHENVIDVLEKYKNGKSIKLYKKLLDNLCVGDYVDRITFQKQIWQFNELSSLIKTMRGNYILHSEFNENIIDNYNPQEVRFTRALTKYSSEFNNFNFIQSMCQKLSLNKSDLFAYFQNIKSNNEKNTANNADMEELLDYLSNYDVSKLELERMFRMITKEEGKRKKNNKQITAYK